MAATPPTVASLNAAIWSETPGGPLGAAGPGGNPRPRTSTEHGCGGEVKIARRRRYLVSPADRHHQSLVQTLWSHVVPTASNNRDRVEPGVSADENAMENGSLPSGAVSDALSRRVVAHTTIKARTPNKDARLPRNRSDREARRRSSSASCQEGNSHGRTTRSRAGCWAGCPKDGRRAVRCRNRQPLIIGNLDDSDIAAKGSESQPAARVTIVQRFRQKALCWVFSAAIQVQ